VDTRKTLPGLRLAQKYAVTCGGGHNHRLGLYDGILIKENHIMAAGGVTAALEQARAIGRDDVFIQIEVETLEQLAEALDAGARMILLDNMDLVQMRQAVGLTAGRAELEASGGVSLETVRAIAETGVNRISIGDLTKNVAPSISRCGTAKADSARIRALPKRQQATAERWMSGLSRTPGKRV
jgi:nicotinate-nucleotide pyrophosphorylase (carboxylating)